MEIQKYKYAGSDFTCDVAFDSNLFVNVTEIYQSANKSDSTFNSFKNRTLIPRAQKLIDMGAIPTPQNAVSADPQEVTVDDLIIVRKGGNDKDAQGTWIHPKLRMVFSRWMSEEFDIWCDMKIEELFTKGYTGLTAAITEELDEYALASRTLKRSYREATKKSSVHMSAKILTAIEVAVKNNVPFDQLIKDLTYSPDFHTRSIIFKRVTKCLQSALAANMISIGQWVDLSTQINEEHNALLYRRINKREKEVARLETEMGNLAVKALQAADQSVVDELNQQIVELDKKLKLYQQDQNTPPVDMSFVRPMYIAEDMEAIEKRVKSSDKCKAFVYGGVLTLHPNHGKKSLKGNQFPDYVANFAPNYSIALWASTMTLKITKGNENVKGFTQIFSTNLEKDRECDSLFHGFKLGTSGTRYYIMYEEVTNSLVIYSA